MKDINYRVLIFFLSFLVQFIFFTSTLAQTPGKIVKLKSQLNHSTGFERMEVLRELGSYYSDKESELAFGYTTRYLKLAQLNNSIKDQAQAYLNFSSIHKFQVDFRAALDANMKALVLFEQLNDSLNVANSHSRIGDSYAFLNQADSSIFHLKKALHYFEYKRDTFRIVVATIHLGKGFCMIDQNETGVEILTRATDLSKIVSSDNTTAWGLYWIGACNIKLGNFSLAKANFEASIYYYRKDGNIHGSLGAMQALGDLYLKTGELAGAYQLFSESNKHRASVKGDIGKKQFICQYNLNIGNIYLKINDFDRAYQMYDSAIAIAQKYKFQNKIALAERFIGSALFSSMRYDSALLYFQKSLSYYQTKRSEFKIAELYNSIGLVHQNAGDYATAFNMFSKALSINQDIDNKYGLVQNHINLATCYRNEGRWELCKKELDSGMPLASQINVDDLLLRYYAFYIDYCEHIGHHSESHKYLKLYIPLSQASTESSIKNLTNLLIDLHKNDLAHEKKIHEQTDSLLQLNTKHDQLKIRQLYIVVLLVAFVLVLIAVLLLSKVKMARRLEKEVIERTRDLKENEKKLIESNQTKDKFYSIIAHDLKSPFNSLIGFSNLLHDEYDDFSDDERRSFIKILRNSSEEIFTLLENLLDWTRKGSDNFSIKPVKIDLQHIVKQTIQLQEKNAELKKITIINAIHKNTFVFADENMLRTIIRNFTSNAIKFTNQNGEIRFTAIPVNGFMECSVSDNGVGMSPEVIGKLFDIQSTVQKKGTANEKGTGLGLMLCKDFIERNGGQLSIVSQEGKGSTFAFTLPVKPQKPPSSPDKLS